MSINTTLEKKPHVLFFKITLIILTLSIALYNYDQKSDYSFDNQGDIERFLRLILGLFAMLTPQLLFYVLIYWLMHNFKRPTRPKFNVIHFWLFVFSIVLQLAVGLEMWYARKSIAINETSMLEIFSMLVSIAVVFLFLYNVIISLVKKNKNEKVDEPDL